MKASQKQKHHFDSEAWGDRPKKPPRKAALIAANARVGQKYFKKRVVEKRVRRKRQLNKLMEQESKLWT